MDFLVFIMKTANTLTHLEKAAWV